MKYEMIFGDDDFSGQSNELAEVKLWNDLLGPNFVSMEELHCMSAGGLIPRGSVILAMRRIIAEPKREENEFVSLVESEYNKMPNEISFRAGIRAAYRKLKGGE